MRPEKAYILEDLQTRFQASPFLLVADYSGLKVDEFSKLRDRLVEAGARCQVVKNSFLRRATAAVGVPDLSEHLTGQTAVITGESDVAAAAKVLKKFTAEFKKFTVRAGVLENKVLGKADIDALADLPSKAALQSQLLGLLNAPATQLVRLLNEPGSMLARLLQAAIDKQSAGAPAAAEAPAA
ncbi:MAG: 50S ribosomal protein L10 [Verrucomicrobia bacterium]|nr:50S ribosomal protein L10 [Verrucomicrobiota bacterium]